MVEDYLKRHNSKIRRNMSRQENMEKIFQKRDALNIG